jgi:hypothetical protein
LIYNSGLKGARINQNGAPALSFLRERLSSHDLQTDGASRLKASPTEHREK